MSFPANPSWSLGTVQRGGRLAKPPPRRANYEHRRNGGRAQRPPERENLLLMRSRAVGIDKRQNGSAFIQQLNNSTPALGVKVMSHVFGWSHSVSHASLEKNDSKMTPENRKFRMVTLHEKRSWPSLVLHSFPVHG
jgi:hypothetical protein